MKNSLFKRAIATAAAVPLALTQCLTYANAVSTDFVKAPAQNVQEGESLKLENLLYIPAEETVSTWNQTLSAAIASIGAEDGEVDVAKFRDDILSRAGAYKEAAAYALDQCIIPNKVNYEITGEYDVVITGKISEPDLNLKIANTPADALHRIADSYNAPALKNVDYSTVKIGGDFKITIGTSALASGKKVAVTFAYTTADGTYGIGELPTYAIKKIEEIRKIGEAAIEKEVAADKVDEAKAKYNAKIDLIIDKLKKAERAVDKTLKADKDGNYSDVAGLISDTNDWLKANGINKQLPGTASEIAAKEFIVKAYDTAIKTIDSKGVVDISAADLGGFADSIKNITFSLANGKAEGIGTFDDAEQADVKAWVEQNGYAFVDSYKKITAKVDFSGIKSVDAGSVEVEIERILVTDTTTTTQVTTTSTETTSTTSTESTSTTTEETTTTDTTSTTTDTTSTSTTSETTSTTSETTSTSTTSETTSTSSETTSTSTDTTSTSTETTSTVTDTTPVVTTVFTKVYATANTENAFYLNTETEFDKAQLSNVILHTVRIEAVVKEDGTIDETTKKETEIEAKDITADVSFGSATPANTYEKTNTSFKYKVPVSANGSVLKDVDGNDFTVTVFIGVKGDINLDNMANSVDASQALAFYAKTSTQGRGVYDVQLSESNLVLTPKSVYDEFAAFLGDVHHVSGAVVDRFATKDKRLIDANDASNILAFYAKRMNSANDQMTDAEIWEDVLA